MRDSNPESSSPWYAPLYLLAAIAITMATIGNTQRSSVSDRVGESHDEVLDLDELEESLGVPALGVIDLGDKPEEPALGAASLSVGELAMIDKSISLDSPILAVEGAIIAKRTRAFPTKGSGYNWQGMFDVVDAHRWQNSGGLGNPATSPGLAGVGFPHLHVKSAPRRLRANSYKRMVSWHDLDGNGRHEPIAHVRCMGLSPKAVAKRAQQYNVLIGSLARQHKVSPSLVKAVIAAESCFDKSAVSRVGALGLMQLMPATAKWLKAGDPRQPEENLKAGIRYLAMLNKRFPDRRHALAAYNAGPGKVRRYGGIPPYQETRQYVQRVMAHYRRYKVASSLGGS